MMDRGAGGAELLDAAELDEVAVAILATPCAWDRQRRAVISSPLPLSFTRIRRVAGVSPSPLTTRPSPLTPRRGLRPGRTSSVLCFQRRPLEFQGGNVVSLTH